MDDAPCPRCGTPNPLDANFCSLCGEVLSERTVLDEDRTAVHPAISATPPDGELAMVVVTSGAMAGARYALGPVTSIGRHPDSGIFLDDVTVSRRHAEIVRDAEQYEVRDAGSLNGTYVNGARVDVAPLAEGDQLQIGKFKLVIVFGPRGGDE